MKHLTEFVADHKQDTGCGIFAVCSAHLLVLEAALKILELTAGKVAAFYDSPTGFRHGPKSLVNAETLVVVFVSSHSYTRQYDLDLLAELHRDQQAMRVAAISAVTSPEIEHGPHILLPTSRHFIDVEQAFCFLMYAQIFALTESIKAGITPAPLLPAAQ